MSMSLATVSTRAARPGTLRGMEFGARVGGHVLGYAMPAALS
jgi:hypothetical protein